MALELKTETQVTLPVPLAEIANRIAKQQRWTFEEAVLFLIKRGAKAQQETEEAVANNYDAFMNADEKQREAAATDLIRAVLGPESLA